jgi:pyruvate/2-oxoglutarate dehydrogenase complex dihydrolipoamide acyltransferase (E2) component
MARYKIQKFPRTRIATIDVTEAGKRRHHIPALIEVDVTKSRQDIREFNKSNSNKISLTAWLISLISRTIKKYETSASFLKGKNKTVIFDDINVSLIVEKKLNDQKVPVPLVIEKASEISVEAITSLIAEARNSEFTEKDITLRKKARRFENIYYLLPGFIRRSFWRYLMKHPRLAFGKMGNVAYTSIGMIGKVNGWFIPLSVHPVCFGISSILKKPAVIDSKIEIREIMNMTILFDHDVIDGADMARFIKDMVNEIESGLKS